MQSACFPINLHRCRSGAAFIFRARWMLNQILRFLLDTVFGFFVFVLLARFYLQLLRAPFRNPLGQFVSALTNWLVLPTRHLIPGMFALDLASILLAWLTEALLLFLLYLLKEGSPGPTSGVLVGIFFSLALLELARFSLYLLIGVILVQAVISWVNPYAPLAPLFNALTCLLY